MQNYFYIANKPRGMSSAQCVNQFKKKLNVKKIGHMGTLDPLAHGILPLAINDFTKMMPYFLLMPKTYYAIIKFGSSTTTDDSEGEILNTSDKIVSLSEVSRALKNFQGKIIQQVPIYSALKVSGQRMYKLARTNPVFEPRAREVEIYKLLFHTYSYPYLAIEITCSAGTYIRAIARDIGIYCDSNAHLYDLCRTAYGPFFLAHSNMSIFDINFINDKQNTN